MRTWMFKTIDLNLYWWLFRNRRDLPLPRLKCKAWVLEDYRFEQEVFHHTDFLTMSQRSVVHSRRVGVKKLETRAFWINHLGLLLAVGSPNSLYDIVPSKGSFCNRVKGSFCAGFLYLINRIPEKLKGLKICLFLNFGFQPATAKDVYCFAFVLAS